MNRHNPIVNVFALHKHSIGSDNDCIASFRRRAQMVCILKACETCEAFSNLFSKAKVSGNGKPRGEASKYKIK